MMQFHQETSDWINQRFWKLYYLKLYNPVEKERIGFESCIILIKSSVIKKRWQMCALLCFTVGYIVCNLKTRIQMFEFIRPKCSIYTMLLNNALNPQGGGGTQMTLFYRVLP